MRCTPISAAWQVVSRSPTSLTRDYVDVIGHGTAVMAAIQEKAPDAEYVAVRVFYSSLRTTVDLLLRAIEWSMANRIDVINLSLGTTNPAHRERFVPVIARALEKGGILVSARDSKWDPDSAGQSPRSDRRQPRLGLSARRLLLPANR